VKFGRPRKLSPQQRELALQLLEQGGKSVQEIGNTFGVERTTIYRLQPA
jgi:DNA invertase Pin-like site-specific DNA recombinase